jgi:uncharacterized coiled-coil DUF342 family protein
VKRAFDENVSKAKPKLRLGKALAGVVELEGEGTLTPPPPRSHDDLRADPHAIAAQVAAEELHAHELSHVPVGQARRAVEEVEALPAPEPVAQVSPMARVAVVAPVEAPPLAESAPAPAVNPVAATVEKAAVAVGLAAARVEEAAVEVARAAAPSSRRNAIRPPAPVAQTESPQIRREKLRERLRQASAPVTTRAPTPASPAEAEAAALSMIGQLQQALEHSEAQTLALSQDLETVRGQLSRAAQEARERTEEAQTLVAESQKRSGLLEELTGELAALESERDDALQQLSVARAEREAEQQKGQELTVQLAAKEHELLEALAEEERFAADLDARTDEVRTLRGLATSLTSERDALMQQVSSLTRERAELADARKALESVHRALADARGRVQPRR